MRKNYVAIVVFALILMILQFGVVCISQNKKISSYLYMPCDINAEIKTKDGLYINTIITETDDQYIYTQYIPERTKVHVCGIHLSGNVEIDSAEIEIDPAIMDYLSNHPIEISGRVIDQAEHVFSSCFFKNKINVLNLDSEELTHKYVCLYILHNSFYLYVIGFATITITSFVLLSKEFIKRNQKPNKIFSVMVVGFNMMVHLCLFILLLSLWGSLFS